MGSALEAILNLKSQEQQRQQFQSEQLTQAVNIFQNARQAAAQNQLAQLQMAQQQGQFNITSKQTQKYQDAQIANLTADNLLQKKQFGLDILKQNSANRTQQQKNIIDLATKGLKQNPDGSIVRDPSLMSDEDNLLKAMKLQAEAQTAGNESAYNFAGELLNKIVPGLGGTRTTEQSKADVTAANQNTALTGTYTEGTTGHSIDTTKLSDEEKYRLAPDNVLSQISSKTDFQGKPTAIGTQAKYVLDQRKTRAGDEANLVGPNFQFDKNVRILKDLINRPDFDWGPFGGARVNSGSSTLANQPELKEIQTYLNDIKQIGFLTGGKNFTEQEKKIVLSNIDPTGKTKEEFIKGLEIANEKVQNKAYALGGVDARKFDLQNNNDTPKRPQDLIPTGGLLNTVGRAALVGQKAVQNLVTLGNADKFNQLLTKLNIQPEEATYLKKNINPQGPIEHLINAAPNVLAMKQLAQMGFGWVGAKQVATKTAQIEGQTIQDLIKLKPIQVMDQTVKNVRTELLKKSDDLGKAGYVQREHEIFSNAIDTIKVSNAEVKNAPTLLDQFALNNKDEFGNFVTPKVKEVYEDLSKTLADSGKVTEAQLQDAIFKLKGKFSGTVDRNKSLNLSAVHDLTQGFSGEAAQTIKLANMRYSQFKPIEKDMDELIGLYGRKVGSKQTDAVSRNLLDTDFSQAPNQSKVLEKIGQETGIDLLGTTKYYGGKEKIANSVNPNILGTNLRNLLRGGVDFVKGKPLPKSGVNSESKRIIDKIKTGSTSQGLK